MLFPTRAASVGVIYESVARGSDVRANRNTRASLGSRTRSPRQKEMGL